MVYLSFSEAFGDFPRIAGRHALVAANNLVVGADVDGFAGLFADRADRVGRVFAVTVAGVPQVADVGGIGQITHGGHAPYRPA